MRNTIKLGLAAAIITGGCGGQARQLVGREGSVHDALAALGFPESGTRSEASLATGGTMQFPIHVESGQCRAFVALGSQGVRDLSIDVLRSDGLRVARDDNHGRNATAVYCASSSSDVEVVVTALEGHGEVVLGVYDASAAGRAGALGRSFGSTCDGAETIEPGAVITGNTSGGRHSMDGSCFEGGSPELYYQVEVAVASRLSLDVVASYDAAVYLLRQCGSLDGELACNDDAGDRRRSHAEAQVEPGTYIVVVDGYGGENGAFELRVTAEALVPMAQLCSEAQHLAAGEQVSISTTGSMDRFHASCAAGARGSDRTLSLDVPQRSRVRLVQQSSEHDGVLYVRRSCGEEASEVACNDDWNGTTQSVITTVLDPGNYTVISDAYGDGSTTVAGPATILAEIESPEGSGVGSDSCTGIATLPTGSEQTLDTFHARDDFSGSCGGQGGADVVRRLTVATRSRLRVNVGAAQFNGEIYLRRGSCDTDPTEVVCRSFSLSRGSRPELVVETVVEPGEYFLVLDGADVENFGSVALNVEVMDLAAAARVCSEAPLLTPGRDVTGTTAGQPNQFEASCAGRAASPDRAYRLVLRRRGFVSITLNSPGFDGALHMRRDCVDASSEVACNDDDGQTTRSRLEGNFDAGTYVVIVDGYSQSSSGSYTLRAEVGAERPNYSPPDQGNMDDVHDAPDGRRGDEMKPSTAGKLQTTAVH